MSTNEWSGKGWTVTVTDTEVALAQASGPVTVSGTNAARLEVRRRWFRWSLHNEGQPLVHLRGITKTEASALLGALRRLALAPAIADAVAWYAANSGAGYQGHAIDTHDWPQQKEEAAGKAGPRAVGTKAPNAWGLYDMLGNAAEWCLDFNGRYPGGKVTDWQGPPEGKFHVRRGGGWSSFGSHTRLAFRQWHEANFSFINLGFRIALAPVIARPPVKP